MKEVFRRATLSDFKAVAAMYESAVGALCDSRIDQWDEVYPAKRMLRADILKRQMFVLTQQQRIVSAVVINRRQHQLYKTAKWSFTRPAVLHRLCVAPEFQHKGYGKKTVGCAEHHLRRTHRCSIRLDAFSQNPSALQLYEGLGYTMVGRVYFRKGEFKLFEKSLVDIVLL